MKKLLPLVLFITACGEDGQTRVRMTNGSPELERIALRQIETLHTIAVRQGYTKFNKTYDVRIVSRSPECDEISFLLRPQRVPVGTFYDGVPEIDKDGAVNGWVSLCAAGRFFEDDGHIEVTEMGVRTTDVVRYEAEHALLRQVDPYRYEATKIHTPDNPHPILR